MWSEERPHANVGRSTCAHATLEFVNRPFNHLIKLKTFGNTERLQTHTSRHTDCQQHRGCGRKQHTQHTQNTCTRSHKSFGTLTRTHKDSKRGTLPPHSIKPCVLLCVCVYVCVCVRRVHSVLLCNPPVGQGARCRSLCQGEHTAAPH